MTGEKITGLQSSSQFTWIFPVGKNVSVPASCKKIQMTGFNQGLLLIKSIPSLGPLCSNLQTTEILRETSQARGPNTLQGKSLPVPLQTGEGLHHKH